MSYETIFLILFASLGFYIKIKYGIIITSLWLTSIIFNFFLTTWGIYMNVEENEPCEIIYISKKGDYNNLYQNFTEFYSIKKNLIYLIYISHLEYSMIILKKIKINWIK